MVLHADARTGFKEMNDFIRACGDRDITIENCLGQRFIGSGIKDKTITVSGTPGNALGAYLDGGTIHLNGNAQDATGDTMNDGMIVVHGSCGDAAGYAMRGGKIYIKGDAGYRAGIHMKEYRDKIPVLMVGGSAGSFLGEYQAGGLIIVLGLHSQKSPVGNFCGTGMHGGKIYLRTQNPPELPEQVSVKKAEDISEIIPYISEFCKLFNLDAKIAGDTFYVLTPNSANPYQQLYVAN